MQTAAAAARTKGPLVFLDYDQEALDDGYNQGKYAPNMQQMFKRFETNSEVTRARWGQPQRFAYGDGDHEKLDLYKTDRPDAPINVFLHGGGWHLRFAKNYGFLAEMFADAGAHYIALDFTGVENTGGSILPIAKQVRSAIAWVYRNAKSFGGDPERLYVSGHSSGGHLGAVILTTDWEKEFGLPSTILKGGLVSGGMYDLVPVSLSARSKAVKFDTETIEQLSPIRHIDKVACDLVVAWGGLETPEFQRQGRAFAEALKAAGKTVKVVVGEGYNHFEFTETLASPYGFLGHAVLRQMELPPLRIGQG